MGECSYNVLAILKVPDNYRQEITVIENEPTTDQFHSGPLENYITELKTTADSMQ